ncbi:MAG: hypothetical protein MIO92_09870 [Methanosarcinaceae archaeon]|nr:hypothetical protein [Methanosarcinaceae archaeon]
MNRAYLTMILLFLMGCAHQGDRIPYSPNITDIENPIGIIKDTIDQQPSCAAMPTRTEVTEKFIRLYFIEGGISPLFGQHEKPLAIYYKNLQELRLIRSLDSKTWRVEIFDKLGSDLYWVYTLDESEAKRFYDALYFMMSKEQ